MEERREERSRQTRMGHRWEMDIPLRLYKKRKKRYMNTKWITCFLVINISIAFKAGTCFSNDDIVYNSSYEYSYSLYENKEEANRMQMKQLQLKNERRVKRMKEDYEKQQTEAEDKRRKGVNLEIGQDWADIPHFTIDHYGLGFAYFSLGQYEKAKEAFQKAEELFQSKGDHEKAQRMQEYLDKIKELVED